MPIFKSTLSKTYSVAALIALAVALFTVLNPKDHEQSRDAVAIVNGAIIPASEYARAIDAMQAGLARALTPEDRARALRLLINEELIVQEAIRLDLARNDRLVRKNLVQALVRSVSSLDVSEPHEDDLRDFFVQNRRLLASAHRYTVQVLELGDTGIKDVFLAALDNGRSFQDAGRIARLRSIAIAPELSVGKISEHLGGGVADTLVKMRIGDIAGPLTAGGVEVFVWLTDIIGGQTDFEAARETTLNEWHRRQEEAALEKYIERLRRSARIKPLIDPESG